MGDSLTMPNLNTLRAALPLDKTSSLSQPTSHLMSTLISTLAPEGPVSRDDTPDPMRRVSCTFSTTDSDAESHGASPYMDALGAMLTSKKCLAFDLNSTLYAHRLVTSAAEAAVLSHVAETHNLSLADVHGAWEAATCPTITHQGACDPSRPLSWPEHYAKVYGALLEQLARDHPGSVEHNGQQNVADESADLFRIFKKTLYPRLTPMPGLMSLLRVLDKRGKDMPRIVVLFDPAATTREQAGWTLEHLMLDNFISACAYMPGTDEAIGRRDSGADTSTKRADRPDADLVFSTAVSNLGLKTSDVVLIGGNLETNVPAAKRAGVQALLVDPNQGTPPIQQRKEGGGVLAVAGLPVLREAMKRTWGAQEPAKS
ncbi:uncharacterized protein K452DRAFT_284027 [Aplosporella prunicola CBS 121167]|uniref:Uncharacterized protein n=1 Tax=Aplosporella prunicola CBS 121167 TaxID=1176127 RepID=A0A6A6BQG0_9PEZI|nr:uncharacterized protein K452DRAFT_284027 [Aplosporella prunicola CBS 121167]KAF2145663.1 hypothetical protein K452DRAFT_284027 [Aplosporella prunicola CBS 121167]